MGLRQALVARLPAAFGVRNFRVYFSGAVVSFVGTWMQTTAQAWLVLQITDSPVALATVAALQFLPITLFSLFGGALADRLPRRRALFFTQSFAAGQALVLGILALTGAVQIWHIYILAFSLGTINAINGPLRQSFVPELVGRDNLPNAVAINSLVMNLGRILGPSLAGIVIAFFGVPAAFFINAVSFAGTLTGLALIREAELHPRIVRPRKGNVFSQIGEGFAFAWRTPSVLFVFIVAAFVGTFGVNFTTIVPLVATYLVHASAAEFGILNSALGTGSMLAALVLSGRGAPTPRRLLFAAMVFGCGLIAISQSTSLPVTAVLFVLLGTATVTFSTSVNTSLQLQAPDHMGGRMVSMFQLLNTGTSPFSAELTGGIAHAFGIGTAVAVNGVMCLVGVAAALLYRSRRIGAGHFQISAAADPPVTAAPAALATATAPST